MPHYNLPHNHGQNMERVLNKMPHTEDFTDIAFLFQQLGDPTRLRILWLLCHCDECVCNIAAAVDMSAPAVSHHLRILKKSGIISSRRDGKEVYYSLADTPQASDNILNYAEKYLRIVFAGSLFVNFFQSANMVIRGEGQLKKAMTIIASGAILNIILDPIFITILNPYGMGIEAAAYATVLSQFIQAAVTLWYFKKKSPNVKIGRIRIDGTLLPQVLSVGVSALLMQILTLVQQTVIYRVASNYGGETSQLLLGAALRFWNFSFVPLWGISQGFQPAAGTNYGAKDYDRVKKLTKVFIIAATLLSLVFYIPVELFPEKILSMFLTTPGIAASGATNFRIMFSTYILQGSFLIAVTLFQSLGKANKATWLVLFRQIILFIPLCVILPMIGGMGIRGVWLAIALTDAILVVITISMMLYEFGKMPATSSVKR